MKKIRNKVFETNSSSTHSFIVSLGENTEYLDISITPDWDAEFGWEWETYYDSQSKLAYILRCYLGYEVHYKNLGNVLDDDSEYLGRDNFEEVENNARILLQPIKERLEALGVNFEYPTYREIEAGHIDHSDWYVDEIMEIIETDEGLLNFIFNPDCEINTGNDNC